MSDTMWGGRFTKAEEKSAQDFNASISFDCRMYREDIAGSLAHAAMLANHNIISRKDLEDITSGLKDIRKQIDDGKFEFSVALEHPHECGEASHRSHRRCGSKAAHSAQQK